MKFSDIHIGDKVIHAPKSGKGFGVGTVLSVKKDTSSSRCSYIANVRFAEDKIKPMDIAFLEKYTKPLQSQKEVEKNFQVGDAVEHKKYGKGTVVDKKGSYLTINFVGGSRSTVTLGSSSYSELEKMSNLVFRVGEKVEHKQYGRGTVVEIKGSFLVVKFEKKDLPITLAPSYLKKAEEIITETLPEVEEEIESKLQVIPSNFSEQACYPTSAKRLVNYLRKQCTSTGFISMKSYQENDGTVGVFVVAGQGIIVFKMIVCFLP